MKPMDLGDIPQALVIAPELSPGFDAYELCNVNKLRINFVFCKMVTVIFIGNIE